jgi:glycosyltransferase involved in cell wall biosynthesis
LYRAFNKLYKENSNVRLLIVGGGIEEQEEMLKSKPGIIFTGSKDDVVPYYQAMDIYVLPSLIETTSLTTMEAMSCGLPVLSTKVGFVKDYIKHNTNGMFFPKRNSYILRKKIENLIENRKLREDLGKNARETIKEKFRWMITVQKIKKILESY